MTDRNNNDMLIKGIIESILKVNQFYQMLPFKGIHGNALAFNRGLSTERFSRHSKELTTLIGDAQVNGFVQAVGSEFNDATALQVAAKAKVNTGLNRADRRYQAKLDRSKI